ncbi:site-specific tyrosine recombinase XerD, partial [Streptococcus thermophilus]|nr:site-specific tyrosine recombinase XerD [Streptococcus thermophilus]
MSKPTIDQKMQDQLADYLHFLRVERGLVENTIKS